MADHTERFTGRADDYDRYRQRYPAEAILTRLRAWCGLAPGWRIADIGAGTGMLAEVFLENGNAVVAVEPNADMRERMRAALGAASAEPPKLEILDAAAEATTLPSASIDMIGVGRAFHWFDQQRALAEFRRILKPGGWVALVAIDRSRDTTEPRFLEQIAAYERMLSESGTDYAQVLSGFRSYDKMDAFFDGEIHQAQLRGSRELDWPTFRGHTMSLSVSPGSDHPGHEAFQRELRRHFETYAVEGVLTIPTTCWITAARFAATQSAEGA